MSTHVQPANPRPCAACPWRLSNQGTRHPDGWYTRANIKRLWSKMRRGDSMTCHPTDPRNRVPEGHKPVPEEATTHECAGALLLQQREFERFQRVVNKHPGLPFQGTIRMYLGTYPNGLNKAGLLTMLNRALSGPWGTRMTLLDLNESGIGCHLLEPWDAATEGRREGDRQ